MKMILDGILFFKIDERKINKNFTFPRQYGGCLHPFKRASNMQLPKPKGAWMQGQYSNLITKGLVNSYWFNTCHYIWIKNTKEQTSQLLVKTGEETEFLCGTHLYGESFLTMFYGLYFIQLHMLTELYIF